MPPNENPRVLGEGFESSVETAPKSTSARQKLKREIDGHLKTWLRTGNSYSRRLALSKGIALRKCRTDHISEILPEALVEMVSRKEDS